jgi:hypothetical protein
MIGTALLVGKLGSALSQAAEGYMFSVSQTEVPSHFFIAFSFNPHQTKGIYLGLDRNVNESHSYLGLPASGFAKVEERYGGMVRVY